MKKTKAFNRTTLQSIASAFGAGQTSAAQTIAEAIEALMQAVECARVSLWRFERIGHARGLRCFGAKRAGEPLAEDGMLLVEDEYREYYAALVERSTFVSNDAMRDTRLIAMRGSYLQKHDISALLDVAVTINGRAYGIVCCEQMGTPHAWSPRQVRVAREAVTYAGMLFARESSIRLDLHESLPIEPF